MRKLYLFSEAEFPKLWQECIQQQHLFYPSLQTIFFSFSKQRLCLWIAQVFEQVQYISSSMLLQVRTSIFILKLVTDIQEGKIILGILPRFNSWLARFDLNCRLQCRKHAGITDNNFSIRSEDTYQLSCTVLWKCKNRQLIVEKTGEFSPLPMELHLSPEKLQTHKKA